MTDLNSSPWIALEGAFNVRDTGGYPADGGSTRPNALLRSDSLHKLTEADREMLVARGLHTVIDLRHAGETSVAANVFAQSEDVLYQAVPVIESQPTSDGAADLGTIYRFMVDSCQRGLLQGLQAIARAPEGAVLIHCTAGKDRTGILTALALSAVGVPRDAVIAEYALTTKAMDRLRPRLVAAAMTPEAVAHLEKLLGSEPELMAELLDYLDERYGGVTGYLDQLGFSAEDRALLHARLVQPHQEMSHV